MPDVDEKWSKLLDMMRSLPPIRNVNAIRSWMTVYKPEVTAVFDHLVRDAATKNIPAPKRMVLFMMMAFAAGRAYQVANPDAERDPDGYGG